MAQSATRLAHALKASGIEQGDRVAYLCPNIPELLVAHFGVPLAEAVLVAINTRLSSEEIRYILGHSGARLLVVDSELTPLIEPVDARPGWSRGDRDGGRHRPRVVTPGDRIRRLHGQGRRRADGLDRGRRGPHHLDQLHQRHDRPTQGCHVHAPGGASQRHGRGDPLPAFVRVGLPVDPPHVPLQRLVYHLGGNRHRWHPCVSAGGRPV